MNTAQASFLNTFKIHIKKNFISDWTNICIVFNKGKFQGKKVRKMVSLGL